MSQINEKSALDTAPAGSIRFNTDSSKMEIYNGEQWWEIDATSPEQQTGGGRGVFAGAVPASDTIQYINIASTGNSIDFGNLTTTRYETEHVSDRTRGVICGGYEAPLRVDKIEYITLASTGDSIDFGDLLEPRGHMSGGSNSTRGVLAGGQKNPGGPTAISEDIFHITIQTLGSYNDFGDLATARWFAGGGRSNSTRVLFAGGGTPAEVNTINYVTISIDFGDLTSSRRGGGSVSDCRRAVLAGGRNPSDLNVIDYVQVMSTGNAVDYGDLLAVGSFNQSGASNGHGGLG